MRPASTSQPKILHDGQTIGEAWMEEKAARFFRALRNPWRAGPGFILVALYILLDRMTVFFQMWSGISAWYPPVGLALGMLVGMGLAYAPLDVTRRSHRGHRELSPVT